MESSKDFNICCHIQIIVIKNLECLWSWIFELLYLNWTIGWVQILVMLVFRGRMFRLCWKPPELEWPFYRILFWNQTYLKSIMQQCPNIFQCSKTQMSANKTRSSWGGTSSLWTKTSKSFSSFVVFSFLLFLKHIYSDTVRSTSLNFFLSTFYRLLSDAGTSIRLNCDFSYRNCWLW